MIDNVWLVAIGVILGLVVALTAVAPLIALHQEGGGSRYSSPSVSALQSINPVNTNGGGWQDDPSFSTGIALDLGLSTVISAGAWDSAAVARLSFWIYVDRPLESEEEQP